MMFLEELFSFLNGNAKHHTGVLALVNTRFFCVSLTQALTTPPLRAPVFPSACSLSLTGDGTDELLSVPTPPRA